jgi:hypothetical protein
VIFGLLGTLAGGLLFGCCAWLTFFAGFPVLDALDAGMIYLIASGVFVETGLVFLVVGLASGLRASALTIDEDGVRLDERGPFGSGTRRWPRAQVATAFAARDAAQLGLADGRMVNFFRGHDPSDVGWAVAVLRRALGLPMEAPGSCLVSRTDDGVTVTLPPESVWRDHKRLLVVALGLGLFTSWNTARGGTLLPLPLLGSLMAASPVWVVWVLRVASVLLFLVLSVAVWGMLIQRSVLRSVVTVRAGGVEFRDVGYDGPFSRRPGYIPRERIASIDVGSYRNDDDDSTERPGISLRVWTHHITGTPGKECYFEERSPMELRWLASLLCEVLGVPRGLPRVGGGRAVDGEDKGGRAA